MVVQIPRALVTQTSDGKMLEMSRKGRGGWDLWHVLVTGLWVGFPGLMQREKSGSELVATQLVFGRRTRALPASPDTLSRSVLAWGGGHTGDPPGILLHLVC